MTKQSRAHLWERRAHAPVNKRCAEQQISPVLEITETQHPHPLVGLFVHLSEGQSTAADRCVCSRFRKRKLRPGSGKGSSTLPPRREDKDQVRMSQIDLFSPLTWTNMIRQWSSLAQKKNTKPWYQKKKCWDAGKCLFHREPPLNERPAGKFSLLRSHIMFSTKGESLFG